MALPPLPFPAQKRGMSSTVSRKVLNRMPGQGTLSRLSHRMASARYAKSGFTQVRCGNEPAGQDEGLLAPEEADSENQRGQPQRIRHSRAPSEKPRSWGGRCQQSSIPVWRSEMQHALFSSEPVLLCGDVLARLFSRTRITQDGD
jgi:hypothetical protein